MNQIQSRIGGRGGVFAYVKKYFLCHREERFFFSAVTFNINLIQRVSCFSFMAQLSEEKY